MPLFRHDGRVIFFAHVPPCAGSSLEDLLTRRLGPPAFLDRRYRRNNSANWTRTSPQHLDVASFARLFPAGFVDATFAVVRHPVARALSAFHFQRDVEKSLPRDLGVSDWIARLQDPEFRALPQFDNHFRAQSDLVPQDATVFRLEDGLDRVVRYLDELTGAAGDVSLGTRLRTKGQKAVLGAAETAALEEIYQQDFLRFGYETAARDSAPAPAPLPAPAPPPARAATPRSLRIAIKTPVKFPRDNPLWGDYHFARGLGDALERLGHKVRLDARVEWRRDPEFSEIDLALRGYLEYPRDPAKFSAIWVLYPGKETGLSDRLIDEFNRTDLVCFASQGAEAAYRGIPRARTPSRVLMQAFDAGRMYAPPMPGDGPPVMVGGNHIARRKLRPMVELAVGAGIDFRLWGGGWRGSAAERFLVEDYIENEKLGDLYRSSRIVLCDHLPSMRVNGYLSNRIFDALACGAAVVSDPVAGLPDEFAPFVTLCDTPQSLADAVRRIGAETTAERQARLDFARSMVGRHCFDARAREISDVLLAKLRT